VSPDDAWAIVEMTIGAAGSAAAGRPGRERECAGRDAGIALGIWLPFLAIGLLLVSRRI